MNVIITKQSEQVYPHGGRYVFVDASCGKHSASVMVHRDYVRVVVENASHRAWGGMGKQFPNMEAAIANYKTAEVKAILRAAQDAFQGEVAA